jgi:hypothetical protein
MRLTRWMAVAVLATAANGALAATYYDGKTTLLCTAHRFAQCDAADGCVPVTADEIGLRGNQWVVDFKNKTFKPANPNVTTQSKIGRVQYNDSTLFAQSIEDGNPNVPDGAAWSLSISDPDGTMTLAVASNSVAFVATGACVPTK